jgi:hypothetical protein
VWRGNAASDRTLMRLKPPPGKGVDPPPPNGYGHPHLLIKQ